MTKLTGKSAETLVKEQEEDLANERYALVQRELRQKAAEGDADALKQIAQNELLMRQDMSKETKIAMQNAIAGYGASSEEGAKLLRTSSDAFNKLASGTFEATDVMDLLKRDSKAYLDQFGSLGKATGDLSKTFLSVQDAMKFEGLKGTAAERVAAAKAEQAAQQKNTEAAVANQVALRQEQVETTKAAQNLISKGLNPVTGAMAKLAGVTEKVVTSLPGTGKNVGTSGTGRGNEQAAGILGTTKAVPNAAPAAPSSAPAAPSAAPSAPPSPAPTAAPGASPVSSAPPSTDNLAQLLKFTGNSGSQSNFNSLNEQLKQAVIQAGAEYNSVTGKNLIINSAKRDSADQQRLWDETVAAGRPGIGPSGMAVGRPGMSLHERGLAVDIQQGKNDQVAIAALNKQNLYQKVANDPVHFQFSAREGGILSGPKSGYTAQLHGDEAVVPLSGGRSIPVEMPALTASMNGQISLMQLQSEQMEELIELMRNNNGISSKILQASKA